VDFSDINGGYNDFRTYNITNPTQPESLGIYTNLPVSPRGQKIRDDIAYLATGRTIKILDVRDPQDIQLINSFEGDWHSAYWIDISGNYMYLATTNTGLRVLNISNEASPVIIGSYDTPGQAYSAKYHGGYVYIADYDSGLTIVDVSTPSAPTEVCRFTQYIGCFDVGFVENNSGSFAIVIFDNQVVALDIADPANPVEVAYYGEIDPHHLVTRGDTIYVADRMSGLHILALGPEDKIDNSGALPGKYFMARNYPNPFNSSTIIEFNQPSDGNVSIQIYDILGRKVANLFNGYLAKGLNRLNWNGTDNSRGQLTGGVYFYKIMSGAMSTTGKMILLK
jgi:hypothetical protein